MEGRQSKRASTGAEALDLRLRTTGWSWFFVRTDGTERHLIAHSRLERHEDAALAALIIGAQLVHFALLVKWIAVVAGIVREPRWVTQARNHTSVEFGLVIGARLRNRRRP